MKKILIALVVLGIMLTGCAKEEVEKVDISELNSYLVNNSLHEILFVQITGMVSVS